MTREYTQFYINGNWVDPISKEIIEVINPANEEVCAHISLGNDSDVNKAVEAAQSAFQTSWRCWQCHPHKVETHASVTALLTYSLPPLFSRTVFCIQTLMMHLH